jgi:hypothetical protein
VPNILDLAWIALVGLAVCYAARALAALALWAVGAVWRVLFDRR